jgi:hypothetical protein
MGCLVTDEVVIPCSPEYEITGAEHLPGAVGVIVGEWLHSQSDDEDQAYIEVQDIGYSVGVYMKRDALGQLLAKLTAVYLKLPEKAS